ncbi:putative reverse transcriptase domain-containing protein [Tanacetum coccineum]
MSDYPADGGDDGDDEDDSSEDDKDDDEVDIEDNDDEEEEEHPTLADSAVVALPAADQAPSAEETEPFKTDESAATPPPTTLAIVLFLAAFCDILGDLLFSSSVPTPVLVRCIALGSTYEVGESSSVAATRPAGGLRADYGFVATMDREIRLDLERDVVYRITDSWDEIVEAIHGTPVVTDVTELSQRMTEFETRVRQDIDDVYMRLDDEQSG